MEIANLYYSQKIKLINAIKKLPFDVIILDLGAGTNYNTIDFFMASNCGVVICTPEPTSIENTFRFVKAVYLRKLKQNIKSGPFGEALQKTVSQNSGKALSAFDILKIVEKNEPEKLPPLKETLSQFNFNIIINQHRKIADPGLGLKMETVCNRHFYSPFRYIGHVEFDARVHDAVYQKKLFVELYPNTSTSLSIKKICRELVRHIPISAEKRRQYERS